MVDGCGLTKAALLFVGEGRFPQQGRRKVYVGCDATSECTSTVHPLLLCTRGLITYVAD